MVADLGISEMELEMMPYWVPPVRVGRYYSYLRGLGSA
jgi:hypothetical protein